MAEREGELISIRNDIMSVDSGDARVGFSFCSSLPMITKK